jgi:RNase P/RNase MRP subunit p29
MWRQVAEGEHDMIGANHPAVCQLDLGPAGPPVQTDRPCLQHAQATVRADRRLMEQAVQIAAVLAPSDESLSLALSLGRQPLGEVIGLIGQGAHVSCSTIEQVGGIAGRVSDALCEGVALLDQGDPRALVPKEVDRQECARKAGPDDGHVPLGRAGTRHGARSVMGVEVSLPG